MDGKEPSTKFLVSVVYVSILLDNVLLTAIVPVLPLHLAEMMDPSPRRQEVLVSPIQTQLNPDVVRGDSSAMNKSTKALTTGRLTLHRVPLKVLQNKQGRLIQDGGKDIEKHSLLNDEPKTFKSSSSVAVDLAKTLGKHLGGSRTGLHFATPAAKVNDIGQDRVLDDGLLSQERATEKIGILLSSKALVQLVANPLVGWWANRVGYTLPLLVGSSYLLVSSLVFSFGRTYVMLFFARSLQGIASACITVAGMGLVAERYEGDEKLRSKIMGHIMGAVALGVLIGYPMGSVLNTVIGQSAPFLLISACMFINTALQFASFKPSVKTKDLLQGELSTSSSKALMKDKFVLITVGAICTSTTAMAVLEPCLPLWLKQTVLDVKDWQLGLIFIPDSLGYLVGTNFLGVLAFKMGRWRAAAVAMFMTGCSALLIPLASRPWHLVVPHFFLGLGIGAVDAALMPLLAYLVDSRHQGATYGAVYALAQFSVSFAYFSGPFVGGEIAESIGFPWLMRIVGLTNVLYSPLCCLLRYHDTTIPLLHAPGLHAEDEDQKSFWKDLVKLPHTTVSYKTMASSASDLAISEEPRSCSSVSTPSISTSAMSTIGKRLSNHIRDGVDHNVASGHVSCEVCKFSPEYLKRMDH